MNSLQIFLDGWCESNYYALRPPKDYVKSVKHTTFCSRDKKKYCCRYSFKGKRLYQRMLAQDL